MSSCCPSIRCGRRRPAGGCADGTTSGDIPILVDHIYHRIDDDALSQTLAQDVPHLRMPVSDHLDDLISLTSAQDTEPLWGALVYGSDT